MKPVFEELSTTAILSSWIKEIQKCYVEINDMSPRSGTPAWYKWLDNHPEERVIDLNINWLKKKDYRTPLSILMNEIYIKEKEEVK